MNQNSQKIAVAVTAAALLMSLFTAIGLNAASNRGAIRMGELKSKTAPMEKVPASGDGNSHPILYGVTVANVANGNDLVTVLRRNRTEIDRISQETTKIFAGVMFGLPNNLVANAFATMGAGQGTADAVIDEVGLAVSNGDKMLIGWKLLPSVAALVLERQGRSDIGVAKILSGKFNIERLNGVLVNKKAEIERYAASLGYLSNVYVEAETLGEKSRPFGFRDVEALPEVLTRNAREAGYVMTSGDNKYTVSLAYGFAALLVAFDEAASAAY